MMNLLPLLTAGYPLRMIIVDKNDVAKVKYVIIADRVVAENWQIVC
ncbi:MAG: hypothetical protein AWM53_01499 [Candidatus Dichloromethanomonas elyunquensis]|nr:MAG: hypothetical protein AWM53_01499 [Candidatus Dichloromethanomonas elyunquensis]